MRRLVAWLGRVAEATLTHRPFWEPESGPAPTDTNHPPIYRKVFPRGKR